SMESSTCSTISRSASAPVSWISRSASVDLPWSICAMIEKLRMLSMAAFMARGLALASGHGKQARQSRRAGSLRGDALLGEERLERDRLAGLGHDRVARRHRLPVRAVGIERLGDHHQIVAGLAVVERIGVVVGGIAEGVEVPAVGQRRGEAQRLLVILG